MVNMPTLLQRIQHRWRVRSRRVGTRFTEPSKMSREPLEQEDDVTLVTLQHIHGYGMSGSTTRTTNRLEELETVDGRRIRTPGILWVSGR